MNPLKKLAGQTAIYGLSSIIGRAVNFLLVPFYANDKVLSTADFGAMTDYYAYVAFFNIVYLFGMETTYFRFANKGDEKHSFNNAVSFILIISTTLSIIFILNAPSVKIFLEESGNTQFIIWLTLVLWIDAIVAIPFALFRQLGKSKKFASIKLLNIGLNIGLNLFFLFFCKGIWDGRFLVEYKYLIEPIYNPELGVGYIFLSNLLANVVFIPLLLPTFKGYAFQLNKEYIRPMINYAIPLVFVGLSGMVNEMLDRILIKKILPNDLYEGKTNLEVLGVYGAVYKISMLVGLVNQAFRYAVEPFFFSQSNEKNSPKTFSEVLSWYVIFMSLAFVGLSNFRELLGSILLGNPDLREGLYVLPILLLANIFLGIYMNLSIWFKLTDKTYIGTIISVSAAAFTIALNFILIPIIGYLGSAITTLACYFFMSVGCYLIGQKEYPVPYEIGRVTRVIVIALICIAPTYLINFHDLWLNIGISTASFLAFLLILYPLELKKLKAKTN